MKRLHKITIGFAVLLAAASCKKYEPLTFTAEKPASVAVQEDIDSLPALKSYLNPATNANFKLGGGVSMDEYVKRGVMYRLANKNFNEVVAGYGMKHGAVVQADGSLALEPVKNFLATATADGVSVYGHTLLWHANQNATYLKILIAPKIIPATGGPTWDLVTGNDFETDNASNYEANTNAKLSFTAAGQGSGGTGRALKITNDAVRANDWDAQFFIKFSPAVKVGEQYELRMDVRSDAAASFSTQAHVVPYSYKYWDFFGTISSTPTWSTYVKQIMVTTDMATSGAIAFNLGKTATNYYFDNVTLKKFNASGGVSTGSDAIANFEGDALGKTYPMTSGGSGTVVTDPKGESGKVLNIQGVQTHPKFTIDIPDGRTLGDYTTLTLDLLATGSTGLYGTGMKMSINDGGLVSFGSPSSFGCPDGAWGRAKIVLPMATMGLTADQKKLRSFTLAVGSGTGSANYYIDNITMQWKTSGDRIIEKTAAEKDSILTKALDTWIAGMMSVAKPYVKAWDVVNEPMDDGKPTELKTAAGRSSIAADEFFWQDYLGKDYAVKAIQLARKYGNAADLLFINDYNLEYSLDKCRGLIDYVKYVESKGAKVDGIGTQMHISTTADKDKIVEMFRLLAATGKLVKISELDIGVGVKTTDAKPEHYQAQAAMYKYVIDKYFEIIHAAQRYGITIWSPLDSPVSSSWRGGEPIGLWNEAYVRKLAYAEVAKALEKNTK